jgi:hypothetical protein
VAKKTETPIAPEPLDDVVGKGRPTPTRREREEARKRPLVSTDRKVSRATANAERERARIGMAAGEERYLPARDKGPQKKFARDYVDARWNVGELLIPVMVVVIVLTFVNVPDVQAIAMIVLYGFFACAVIDAIIAGQMVTRKLAARYDGQVEKVRWYVAMRTFQLRAMRLPKPQVKRGQFPTA